MYPQAEPSRSRPSTASSNCAIPAAYTQTVTVHGDGTYPAPAFQPPGPGTYYWTVELLGRPRDRNTSGELALRRFDRRLAGAARVDRERHGHDERRSATARHGPAQFSYHYNNPCNCGANGNWTFQTVANATGDSRPAVDVHRPARLVRGHRRPRRLRHAQRGDDNHAQPGHAGPASCCTTPSNGFSYSGTQTLSVVAGDTYGFVMRGSNFDSNSFLNGTLTVGTTPATTFSTTATGPVTLGATITDTAALGGVPATPRGTIAFNAYAVPDCSTTPIYTATASVTGSNTYSVPGFTPAEPGTYYWTASYSGDPAHQHARREPGLRRGGRVDHGQRPGERRVDAGAADLARRHRRRHGDRVARPLGPGSLVQGPGHAGRHRPGRPDGAARELRPRGLQRHRAGVQRAHRHRRRCRR